MRNKKCCIITIIVAIVVIAAAVFLFIRYKDEITTFIDKFRETVCKKCSRLLCKDEYSDYADV